MARRRKPEPDAPNGWLIVDKPSGMTSTDVSNVIKRMALGAKCGHGGTLDPLATGLLPIALGAATKTVPYAMDGRKSYRFTVRWGEARDTDDADGSITETRDARPNESSIQDALPALRGIIQQTPPRYSAIKVDGARAYDLARGEETFELKARDIDIQRFDLVEMPDADTAIFDVESGKGAYMRGLARDLGKALGCLGHIAALRRTRVGPFRLDQGHELEYLKSLGRIDRVCPALLPVKTALDDIPALAISESEAADLRNGRAIRLLRKGDLERIEALGLNNEGGGGEFRVETRGDLVAIARFEAGEIKPARVLNF
ncbi:MAG: tRNA pseudouridine(55) synthase TruB [Alphaproteobacteria bacterium]